MEMFTIFLCTTIGHAFCDLQRDEIGKDDLKDREDANGALSPNVKEASNLDESLQSKDVQSNSSNETETKEKPSPLMARAQVTFDSSEVKKNEKKVYVEKGESVDKDSVKFRSFPVTPVAFHRRSKHFAIKTSRPRPFRAKRAQLDRSRTILEPVLGNLNTEPHRENMSHKSPNETILEERKEEKLADIENSREQDNAPIPQTTLARLMAVSYSAMRCLLNRLPDVLQSKILITDDAEKVVLESYVKSEGVSPDTLNIYDLAKKDERELLKRLLKDMLIILPIYKALRKGVTWNYTRLHDKFKEFFQKPSTALEQYEALKRHELTSLDSFLGGLNRNVGATESTTKHEPKENGNPRGTVSVNREEIRTMEWTQNSNIKDEEIRRTFEVKIKRNEDENISTDSEKPYCGRLEVELSAAEKLEILKVHNDARRREDATNMLQMVWDEELARMAQYKANMCKYYHSMRKGCQGDVLGQNLYTNYVVSGNMAYPPLNYTRITYEWADERNHWNWATLTCHEGKKCGHWRAVTGAKAGKIGCGRARCPKLVVHGKHASSANLVVCDYSPFSMEFERGSRCSNCGNSTVEMDEKGFTCENELCVPCDPKKKKKKGCKCGPQLQCINGGQYSADTCGCQCPVDNYGTFCEISQCLAYVRTLTRSCARNTLLSATAKARRVGYGLLVRKLATRAVNFHDQVPASPNKSLFSPRIIG